MAASSGISSFVLGEISRLTVSHSSVLSDGCDGVFSELQSNRGRFGTSLLNDYTYLIIIDRLT